MARVVAIADSHFKAAAGGRFEECVRVHDKIAQDIHLMSPAPDLVLHAGDVFDTKSTPDERRAVAAWIAKVTEVAPMLLVKGNHDAPRDLTIFEKLHTQHEVVVEETAGVHYVGGFAIAALAWPTKAGVLAMGGEQVLGHGEGEQLAGEALRNVLRGFGHQLQDRHAGWPRILVAHAMVRGSKVSTGQPLVGCDFELGLEDLALAQADFYILGHIHLPQEWTHAQRTIVYPGSPRRTAFGEFEDKSYLVVDFEGRELARWQRVPIPCTPMQHFDAAYDPAVGLAITSRQFPSAERVQGAEVRVRYEVASDQRAAAKTLAVAMRAELFELGALAVQIEEVVRPEQTARAPEVATARTLGEKLRAYWRARNTVPESDRERRLLGKASDLEGSL